MPENRRPDPQSPEENMFCPECGFDAEEARFCPECGTNLELVRSVAAETDIDDETGRAPRPARRTTGSRGRAPSRKSPSRPPRPRPQPGRSQTARAQPARTKKPGVSPPRSSG